MKPLLVDANLLVVWLVGASDPSKLGKTRKVKEYSLADFEFINSFIQNCSSVLVVPNILTQVSDLIGEDGSLLVREIDIRFSYFVRSSVEIYLPSKPLIDNVYFSKLGLADVAMIECVKDNKACLLTADHKLHGVAESLGLESYNIWHRYTPQWVKS